MPLGKRRARGKFPGTAKKLKFTSVKKRAPPRTMSGTRRLIRKIVLKTSETKYKTLSLPKQELYHNLLHNFGTNLVSSFPLQGDTDASRNGDEIYATGMMVRMMFGQKLDRPNVTYKVWVVGYNDNSQDLTTYGNFLHNTTGNVLLDSVQTKRYKILKSLTLKSRGTSMEVGEAGKEFIRTAKFWLPIKKKIKFIKDDSNSSSNYYPHINIIVSPYDAYGTLNTDNIGYAQASATLYYKDP